MLAVGVPHLGTERSDMPVDLSSYLLASSPPVFDFYEYPRDDLLQQLRDSCKQSFKQREYESFDLLQSCVDTDDQQDVFRGETTPEDKSPVTDAPHSLLILSKNNRPKKRVTFADYNGLALSTVKIMTEPSDQPPKLPQSILEAVTEGVKASATSDAPLEIKFPQPAADYMKFRDKIQNNFVSLENVIVKEYHVYGTVKVKNVSFEKKVFARFTHDSWGKYDDIPAEYLPLGAGESSQYSSIDTFSFEFDVPATFDPSKRIEFAICYEENGIQHWDSNDGQNYGIAKANCNSGHVSDTPKYVQTVTDLPGVKSWADISSWKYVDTSVPYW
ncbi:protein phosphatase 1 regulatory subunit 3B [Lingula anatina]|uniref:Protein phosphatase 1 regulatory subunit 3B n=1 Tax=Lingula anatina TaxID=7574 RepID=A0A1S3II49_LINAN|nr:protein phosphatase 1 regulatory subunit 3B [Lingula anatina]XP_013391610.1 protein phosphatase 1 regulatory subunit 3B [Lingula anatina]XP_013397914.1 protein phosphatase 1 regulatory subunit 3B [Lingula anatina]XP_013397915.1 protein phosphatase 1 regulatory subunit 3B [Lingula anatina]|eukprot:XP_013391609.1 protein phosphatase 1 regulatory subunit 3B [Lingula anatina]